MTIYCNLTPLVLYGDKKKKINHDNNNELLIIKYKILSLKKIVYTITTNNSYINTGNTNGNYNVKSVFVLISCSIYVTTIYTTDVGVH